MRKSVVGLSVLAILALAAAPTQAQLTLGPTLAYDNDVDFGVGAELGMPLSSLSDGLGAVADFLVFFPEGPLDYFELNANMTYDFPIDDAPVVPFALAGLNLARVSGDILGVSVSDTQLGLNLGGGIEFQAGPVRPKVGVRAEISGGEAVALFAAVPFSLGG